MSLAMVLPIAIIVTIVVLLVKHIGIGPTATAPQQHVYTAPPPGKAVHAQVTATRLIGVYEPGTPKSFAPVAAFGQAVGFEPQLDLYYSGWWMPFQKKFADEVRAAGAIPMIDMIPIGKGASVTDVAKGKDDRYLRSFAEQVREYGHAVVLCFAPEANGHWYPWGWTRMKSSVWVAAWRHVVTVFRHQGADNVTWLWTVNRSGNANKARIRTGPLRDYWPGSQYVDWVGIDGYLEIPAETFRSVFGPTIRSIRAITHSPILIAETAIGPDTKHVNRDITEMFAGVQQYHLLGLVMFNKSQNGGIYHQNWRLTGKSLTFFAKAARAYLGLAGGGPAPSTSASGR